MKTIYITIILLVSLGCYGQIKKFDHLNLQNAFYFPDVDSIELTYSNNIGWKVVQHYNKQGYLEAERVYDNNILNARKSRSYKISLNERTVTVGKNRKLYYDENFLFIKAIQNSSRYGTYTHSSYDKNKKEFIQFEGSGAIDRKYINFNLDKNYFFKSCDQLSLQDGSVKQSFMVTRMDQNNEKLKEVILKNGVTKEALYEYIFDEKGNWIEKGIKQIYGSKKTIFRKIYYSSEKSVQIPTIKKIVHVNKKRRKIYTSEFNINGIIFSKKVQEYGFNGQDTILSYDFKYDSKGNRIDVFGEYYNKEYSHIYKTEYSNGGKEITDIYSSGTQSIRSKKTLDDFGRITTFEKPGKKIIYEYLQNGDEKRYLYYDGKFTEYEIIKFDVAGNPIKTLEFDVNDRLKGIYFREFDDYGNETSSKNTDGSTGDTINDLWEYKYKYDEFGNWISKTTIESIRTYVKGRGVVVEETRDIEYYQSTHLNVSNKKDYSSNMNTSGVQNFKPLIEENTGKSNTIYIAERHKPIFDNCINSYSISGGEKNSNHDFKQLESIFNQIVKSSTRFTPSNEGEFDNSINTTEVNFKVKDIKYTHKGKSESGKDRGYSCLINYQIHFEDHFTKPKLFIHQDSLNGSSGSNNLLVHTTKEKALASALKFFRNDFQKLIQAVHPLSLNVDSFEFDKKGRIEYVVLNSTTNTFNKNKQKFILHLSKALELSNNRLNLNSKIGVVVYKKINGSFILKCKVPNSLRDTLTKFVGKENQIKAYSIN